MSQNCLQIKGPQHFTGSVVRETMTSVLNDLQKDQLSSVFFDFAGSDLIDSSGIGVLVTLSKECRLRGVELVIGNLNDDLYQLFCDAGLDRIFTIKKNGGLIKAQVDLFETSVDIKLTVQKEILDDICVFVLSGVLTHPGGSSYLKQQFLLSLAQHRKILLDVEDLTFFDSLSLGTVLNMNNLLKGTGGSMRMCGANYIVSDLFSTLKLELLIPIFPSRPDAIQDWDLPV